MACVWLAGGAVAVPLSITYQGVLSEVDGAGSVVIMTAPTAMLEVRLYDAPTGGTALWGHEISVTLADGAFNMIISDAAGSAVAPPAVSAVLEDVIQGATGPMYIGLTVSGGSEITPRQQMLSAPYAVAAKSAEKSVGTFAVGSHLNVTGNAVVGQQLQVAGSSSLSGNLSVVAPGTISGYGTIPLGGIIMWSGGAVPDGWALCDGSTGTPDLRGRFVLGSGTGASLTPRTIGQSGGEEETILTVAQMPQHAHGITDPGHTHSYTYDNVYAWEDTSRSWEDEYLMRYQDNVAGVTGSKQTGITINNAGSSAAHNTMPPFYVLAYIMRVK